MNAGAWFHSQSFNGRIQPEPLSSIKIEGCAYPGDGVRVVTVRVNGEAVELVYGPNDRIPSSEELIRRAKQAKGLL